MDVPIIKTARLVLRTFSEQDIDPLFHILQEKDVLRYFPPNPNPLNRERAERIITRQQEHWQEHGYGWWGVESQNDKELIGWCGLQYLPETDEVEVAYLLSKAYWGKGLAIEAAQASLHFGFENLGFERIVGIVHLENIASQRVLEKLGMQLTEAKEYFGMDCYRYKIERLNDKNVPVRLIPD